MNWPSLERAHWRGESETVIERWVCLSEEELGEGVLVGVSSILKALVGGKGETREHLLESYEIYLTKLKKR